MSPNRDPLEHVEAAETLFVRIQQHIDEGNASQYSIDVLQGLKKLAGILRGHIEELIKMALPSRRREHLW